VLRPLLQTVNMVSAPTVARERGIAVEEVRRAQEGAFESYIRLTVITERQERSVAGTVFSNGHPRLIQIKGINMEAELGPHMLYVTNLDKPGFIGRLGTVLGENGVNIATFNLGRSRAGEDAIALVEVDEPISDGVLAKVAKLQDVVQAKRLSF
jgi:D-3-phosphoglycerate dehydrogenase